MSLSEVINILLGGGLIATILAILTLKSSVRKAVAEAEQAKAEAEKAKAEAETIRITNTELATRVLIENIVNPLKGELQETRTVLDEYKKELASHKRELARLRKALDAANRCKHHDNCPVLNGLRDIQKSGGEPAADGKYKAKGQPLARDATDKDGKDSTICSEAAGDTTEPP